MKTFRPLSAVAGERSSGAAVASWPPRAPQEETAANGGSAAVEGRLELQVMRQIAPELSTMLTETQL
jgi:hypothetical protein